MSINNETLGITVEKVISDLSGLKYPEHIKERSHKTYEERLREPLQNFLEEYPELKLKEHLGYDNKSIDFLLDNGKTLSVKSNKSRDGKVCPQNIGQISRDKFDKKLLETDEVSIEIDDFYRKKYILDNPLILVNKYFENLFCCDYLLWVYKDKTKFKTKLFSKDELSNKILEPKRITFTRYLEKWNESSTIKYDGVSFGEFQFHKKRNNVKFRFIMNKLLRLCR